MFWSFGSYAPYYSINNDDSISRGIQLLQTVELEKLQIMFERRETSRDNQIFGHLKRKNSQVYKSYIFNTYTHTHKHTKTRAESSTLVYTVVNYYNL